MLSRRIAERFAGSGLHAVSRRLSGLAAAAGDRAASIARPIWGLRVLAAVFVGAVLMVSVVAIVQWQPTGEELTWAELIQVIEAGINDVVLIGLGVFFLFTIGIRIRRRRALRALHELRAVAHIIDMHQLTKDPERRAFMARKRSSSSSSSLEPRSTSSRATEQGRGRDWQARAGSSRRDPAAK